MRHLQIIPIIIQAKLDFSAFTIGLLTFLNEETGQATALFHLGVSEDSGLTFDVLFLQGLLAKYT